MKPCKECNFQLWIPLANLSVSKVGLYDDGRYPGRCIVLLNQHYEHLDEVPAEIAFSFLSDIKHVSRVLRAIPEVTRINQAVLGNQEPHVHAHVIPRRISDKNYTKAPWDQAEDKRGLAKEQLELITEYLKQSLR